MKKRNPAIAILLSLVTCGIYGLFWIASLNDDVKEMTGDQTGFSGGMVVLLSLITCGLFSIYWNYKMGDAIGKYHAAKDGVSNNTAILYLLLTVLGVQIVNYVLMQNEINKYIDENAAEA